MQQFTSQTAPQIDDLRGLPYRVADHREAWVDIMPGLLALLARHAEADWTISGMRRLLDEDLAILLVDAEDPKAFAIVRFDDYPYADGVTELFVYLAWHRGGDAIARFQPHLEAFAQLGGATIMRFQSRRRG